MEQALYSILYAGDSIDLEQCAKQLDHGLKLICFLSENGNNTLSKSDWNYKQHPYFKLYNNPHDLELVINDGKMTGENRESLYKLAKGDSRFNIEQYLVEHANKEANLCVEAGAGTGKTTVMIDRIMFLFHTDPNFSFEKVVMITFTNKATDNMRHRLLKELNRRYDYTHDFKYLKGLEEVSQISISTIHSFFRRIINEVGPLMGYGTNMKMRSYVQEKKEILRDLLNSAYGNSTTSVIKQFGLSVNDLENLASGYWSKMEDNGLTDDEIKNLNWGRNTDSNADKIQKQLVHIFSRVEKEYNEKKLRNNAISMKDIIHELGRVIHLDEAKEYITSSFSYIFCDEFQDTDIVQIKTICLLAQIYNSKLFVVGDIKQSIYRFRGATDAAFQHLAERADNIEFESASLVKNYRTYKPILDRLHKIFSRWNQKQFIRYEEKDQLEAQAPEGKEHDKGKYKQIKVTNATRKNTVMALIKEIMKNDPAAIVTILTRTNNELQQVRTWCEEDPEIIHQIKEKGSFFTSPPVLDLCAMLEGVLYDGIPMYVWGLCNTPYVEKVKYLDYEELIALNGNQYRVLEMLYTSFNKEKWDNYKENLRNKPILSVIREIIDECSPIERYALKRVEELQNKGLDENTIINQVTLDTRSYKANLEKLLQMLQDRFSSDFSSLYDICNYLRIRIETDSDEEQAPIEREITKGYVEGYTVHSAKGLEFDHVFIPFMKFPFIQNFRSEILISDDNTSVGWIYRKNKDNKPIVIANNNYEHMKKCEDLELIRDETRLLYVAMTRAIKSLYCFPTRRWGVEGINDWSGLLAEEEDNA